MGLGVGLGRSCASAARPRWQEVASAVASDEVPSV